MVSACRLPYSKYFANTHSAERRKYMRGRPQLCMCVHHPGKTSNIPSWTVTDVSAKPPAAKPVGSPEDGCSSLFPSSCHSSINSSLLSMSPTTGEILGRSSPRRYAPLVIDHDAAPFPSFYTRLKMPLHEARLCSTTSFILRSGADYPHPYPPSGSTSSVCDLCYALTICRHNLNDGILTANVHKFRRSS